MQARFFDIVKLLLAGLCLWAAIFVPAPVVAQEERAQKDKKAVSGRLMQALERTFTDRADQALGRYLPKEKFRVLVSVKVQGQGPEIPYLTSDIAPDALSKLPSSRLSERCQAIDVQVQVAQELPKEAQTAISELIAHELALDLTRGDKVAFFALSLPSLAEKRGQDLEVLKLEARLRDAQKAESTAQRDRNDLKAELIQARAAAEQAARSVTEKEAQLRAFEAAQKMVQDGKAGAEPESIKRTLKLHVPHFMIAGLVFILLLIVAATRAKASSLIGGAMADAAKAFESIGQALASGGGRGEVTPALTPQTASGASRGQDENRSVIPTVPLEALQARILALHDEITQQLNPMTEAIVVRHLTRLLSQPEEAGRAVVTMELMGKEKANEMFGRLNLECQEAVLRFLRTGSYGRAKGELMLEAGEELVTKLLADSFSRQRCELDERVTGKLLRMQSDEIARMMRAVEQSAIPRLLLYLDANMIAHVLKVLKASDALRYERLIAVLGSLPSAERDTAADEQILQALDLQMSRMRGDVHRPYLPLYQEILEGADESMSDEIIRKLSASSPTLEAHLRSRVLSTRTLFQINPTRRAEVMASLGNRDLAALFLSLGDEEREELAKTLTPRRKSAVEEEGQRLSEVAESERQNLVKKAKASVLEQLKKLRSQGLIDTDSTSEANDSPKVAA